MSTANVCARCGKNRLTRGNGSTSWGALCGTCYREKPYAAGKTVWVMDSQDRMLALVAPPVLINDVPFVAGATPTQRPGFCWTCGQNIPAGEGETVWEPGDNAQHALCRRCVWGTAYSMLWPEITGDVAVAVARVQARHQAPMRVLMIASQIYGYTADAVAGGAITPDLQATFAGDADAHDAATRRVRVGTDMRPYPGDLPPELARWHEWIADSGHCIHAVLDQHTAGMTVAEYPDLLVPLPVGIFNHHRWEERDGFIVVHGVEYDENVGAIVDPADEEW